MASGGVDGGELRYGLLGPLLVRRAQAECDAGPAMQRAVLAVLLVGANEPVPREQIVQAVWGPRATANSPGLVATYVSRLRQLLEPDRPRRALDGVLSSRGAAYRLAVGAGCLDLHEFEAARLRARSQRTSGDLPGALAALDGALALWRGGALDGLPGPFAALHRGRLAELRLASAEERFELALLLGRHHEVVAELGLLAAGHPHRERLRGLLMLALYRAGRQSEALAVFAETRQLLVADLGLLPGRELDELHRRILCTDPRLELDGPAAAGPGPLRVTWRPAQLPTDLADFTGRTAEVRAVCRILGTGPVRRMGAVPVVVLSGPPGVGKTATAVHAAHRLRERFPDGQLYAALHEADGRPREPAELLGRLLTDLGVEPALLPAGPESRAALFRSVASGRRLLLVLDDAAGERQVAALLPGSPGCAVLVTSRGRLAGLPGAWAVPLDCLGPVEEGRLLGRLLAEAGERAGPGPGPRAAAGGGAGAGAGGQQAVLAACAGLPLALRSAVARVAARPGRGLAPLVARLADERRRLAELSPGGGGVAQALGSAERRLLDGPGGAAAAWALRSLSRSVQGPGADGFTAERAGRLLGRTEERAEELLDLLTAHGLLLAAADGRYRLHPLTALYGRHGTPPVPSPSSAPVPSPSDELPGGRPVAGWTADGIRMPSDRIRPPA
ncbi:hypothetical protein GCM10009665_53730 [Kitasatospora nipponensis]|uniref:OmpR/PhoB-type domain-containing protein n=1 Tax=Kitasatospora nipponensis TaxID=258049 RepID=A0ABN1WQN1_9ACTN